MEASAYTNLAFASKRATMPIGAIMDARNKDAITYNALLLEKVSKIVRPSLLLIELSEQSLYNYS
jgi:hypothetical protein